MSANHDNQADGLHARVDHQLLVSMILQGQLHNKIHPSKCLLYSLWPNLQRHIVCTWPSPVQWRSDSLVDIWQYRTCQLTQKTLVGRFQVCTVQKLTMVVYSEIETETITVCSAVQYIALVNTHIVRWTPHSGHTCTHMHVHTCTYILTHL